MRTDCRPSIQPRYADFFDRGPCRIRESTSVAFAIFALAALGKAALEDETPGFNEIASKRLTIHFCRGNGRSGRA